ncbi:SRPBCC domain-containing protein [Sphingobacterium bovistauri]|uniref:SRPBCC domain-containing protein n=1 Tax=Sphingobacterium bovistauri TaxID=2781959 RepID=A0ABS7Z4K4_9SPHI|nr:SRPBCC domain-containing protein [Sphingobacterium bovistauri]MCA5005121.1 SRPBCC domain-containing protein [Sphingobacterium bovistauri]
MIEALTAKAAIQILKPIEVVYDAIVNPEKMSQYFIERGTGRLDEGTVVDWKFPEFDDIFPVEGRLTQSHDYISFDWSGGTPDMLVEIFLEKISPTATVVRIKEGTFSTDVDDIKQVIGQTEGWANFLACLKAYLEYGINLRKGAFDFMKH